MCVIVTYIGCYVIGLVEIDSSWKYFTVFFIILVKYVFIVSINVCTACGIYSHLTGSVAFMKLGVEISISFFAVQFAFN